MEKVNPTVENWRVQFTSLICLISGRLYLTKVYIKNWLCPGTFCIITLCLKKNPQKGRKCIRSKRKCVKMRMFMCFSRFGRICEKLCKKMKYSWADYDKLQLYLKKSIMLCLPSTWIKNMKIKAIYFFVDTGLWSKAIKKIMEMLIPNSAYSFVVVYLCINDLLYTL